jgi:hypothetical protein
MYIDEEWHFIAVVTEPVPDNLARQRAVFYVDGEKWGAYIPLQARNDDSGTPANVGSCIRNNVTVDDLVVKVGTILIHCTHTHTLYSYSYTILILIHYEHTLYSYSYTILILTHYTHTHTLDSYTVLTHYLVVKGRE